MRIDDEKTKQLTPTTPPPVDGFDGFTDEVEGAETDERAASGSLIAGHLVKFTNEFTWVLRDGAEVPPDLELITVDILRIVQKWIDKHPVEARVLAPGEKVPNIEALNAACPKSEWGKDFFNNKPQGPWQFQYLTFFIDPLTMDRYTYPTNTDGGGICVRDLVEKVKWMRKFRGQHVFAVLTLANTFMQTRWGGRQRPHFIVKRWVQMGGGAPALPSPPTEPLPGMKVVEEATLSEEMGDCIPYNGSLDLDTPDKPATASSKPAAQSRVTKRGVQKIARGR